MRTIIVLSLAALGIAGCGKRRQRLDTRRRRLDERLWRHHGPDRWRPRRRQLGALRSERRPPPLRARHTERPRGGPGQGRDPERRRLRRLHGPARVSLAEQRPHRRHDRRHARRARARRQSAPLVRRAAPAADRRSYRSRPRGSRPKACRGVPWRPRSLRQEPAAARRGGPAHQNAVRRTSDRVHRARSRLPRGGARAAQTSHLPRSRARSRTAASRRPKPLHP